MRLAVSSGVAEAGAGAGGGLEAAGDTARLLATAVSVSAVSCWCGSALMPPSADPGAV